MGGAGSPDRPGIQDGDDRHPKAAIKRLKTLFEGRSLILQTPAQVLLIFIIIIAVQPRLPPRLFF
jgi:hypothetical protein